jgi:hypothetical protein
MEPSKSEINPNQPKPDLSVTNTGVKDFIIFCWVVFLFTISILAIGGNISRLVELLSGITEKAISSNKNESCNSQKVSTPTDYLNCYIDTKYAGKFSDEIPPIGTVLDLLQVNTSWRETTQKQQDDRKQEDYIILFEIVETKLKALAANDLQDININQLTISNDILIPLEAQNWLITEKNQRRRLKLVDTFGLLIMLGALGSIIFLIREHIDPKKETPIRSYFYKPIFGILLAIATFVVNLSVNGLTSTARVEDLRTEGILLLAFAAGLLSDQTYERLTKAANQDFQTNDRSPAPPK